MGTPCTWRELYRSSDLQEARAVAISVLAMEFEARLLSQPSARLPAGDEEQDLGDPPFVVEVPEQQWLELMDVLPEIIAEQREFDARCETTRAQRERGQAALLLMLGGATGIPPMLEVLFR